MVRFLLVLLAVLVVGLAVLFGRPWLYVATGLILVGGLGGLGWWLWTAFGQDQAAPERPSPAPDAEDPSLDDLGIMDIQPKEAGPDASEPPPDEAAEHSGPQTPPNTAAPAESDASSGPPPTSVDTPQPSSATDPPAQEDTDGEENSVFAPLLEAARAALDARTVGLLVQEDVALTYRIKALASRHPSVRKSGSFDTQTPLLTATMSRESVAYRSLTGAEVAVEDLGYYDDPPTVDHLALAPVAQPDSSSTTFLVADASSDVDLGASRARTVLSHFADTVALLLDTDRSPDGPEPTSSPEGAHEVEDADLLAPNANGTPEADLEADEDPEASPRPRRELIAEEMETARSSSEPLALALVHLNRAESIARQGEEAVASAERLFEARLEQKAPSQRVERFGELTYGVFFRAGPDTIEPWIADFEAAMAQEQGQLEGGASVGVALWTDETPEALRTAATEALREAYETGTCTIVT
ncbi:GGDEF domain-containing protein [Salinibacter ruber]|uniref:GGDEF domain-containing protein n=1 Tax=Salinibacter ruber TaxID=146919 RepID=UPI00216960EC|nr:GGDEF domain-containing protein [Salinibacter ruber]MCS3641971.1 GGDEF domain-containing protein [Salinibacter ruber]